MPSTTLSESAAPSRLQAVAASSANAASAAPAMTPATLKRFDVSGPRYTSYPTADRFVEAFGREDYAQALRQRRMGT
ncbi:MAG: hypothetical protein WA159_02165, partial [Variovorax sp.]